MSEQVTGCVDACGERGCGVRGRLGSPRGQVGAGEFPAEVRPHAPPVGGGHCVVHGKDSGVMRVRGSVWQQRRHPAGGGEGSGTESPVRAGVVSGDGNPGDGRGICEFSGPQDAGECADCGGHCVGGDDGVGVTCDPLCCCVVWGVRGVEKHGHAHGVSVRQCCGEHCGVLLRVMGRLRTAL